jgi:anthranilate synthase component 1
MDGVLTAIDRIREGDESDAEGDDADPIATGSEAER